MKERIVSVLELESQRIFTYGKDKSWTYSDLKQFIIKFSNYAKQNSLERVAITLPNGFYAYAIIISCYLAGVTYCVVNEDNPLERRKYIYSNFAPDLIISNQEEDCLMIDKVQKLEPLLETIVSINEKEIYMNQNSIVYVSFTSGTTSQPKGCRIWATALEEHIQNDLEIFQFHPEDRIGQYVPIHFDMSALDIYGAATTGASLVQFGKRDKFKPDVLIQKYQITFLNIVPHVIDILNNCGGLNSATLSSLRMIRFGGDKVYKSKAELLFQLNPKLDIVSTYGPTETTMFSTYCKVNKQNIDEMSTDILSIGNPICGSKLMLSNVVDGVGEIVIYGDYVGEGYLGDEQGGYANVVIDDVKQKAYFTGDYATKKDEMYFFVGRKDQQIKRNGNRISLLEIESALTKFTKKECAVVFLKNKIICIIGDEEKEQISSANVFSYLKTLFPPYALPSNIMYFDKVPHNSNGKVDYRQLKELLDHI